MPIRCCAVLGNRVHSELKLPRLAGSGPAGGNWTAIEAARKVSPPMKSRCVYFRSFDLGCDKAAGVLISVRVRVLQEDMGVFIISPTDKGGELCQSLPALTEPTLFFNSSD